jgi:hypothetical protein
MSSRNASNVFCMVDFARSVGIRASIDGDLQLKTKDDEIVIFDFTLDSFSEGGSLKTVSLGLQV